LNTQEIQAILKEKLGEYRYYHTMCVAEEAKKLAARYGADEEKAYFAGLLHDILKDIPKEEQLKILQDSDVPLDETALASPYVWHGWAAAVYIRSRLHVEDDEIISAVRVHTTGRKDMTLLDKIVYIADFVSKDRTYDSVEIFRQSAYSDLNKTVYEALRYTIADLTEKNRPICADTFLAYNQYALLFKEDQ